ncbi:outer membrane protein transport protein, partial [bacterium]|nr:outer membrane protein transport protein [bacterium]
MARSKLIKIVFLFVSAFVFGLSNQVASQEQVSVDDIFLPGIQLGAGARALSMGGAYSSLGSDYSAAFWNPAALADIRRVEIYGSLSHLMRDNATNFGALSTDHDASFTQINEIGLAYPVPTVRGSLVFGFGYHRLKSYDENFAFQWFNDTPDDSVTQAWRENGTGSLNAWVLSGAVDVSPNMSLGVGLNFWTGGQDFEDTFRERDSENIYSFDAFTHENTLNTDITGVNLKAGGLIRMGRMMRLGFSVATPTTFTVEEKWSERDELVWDDGALEDSLETGTFEYKVQSPWTFSAGASLSLLNFVFSGDVEYNDWSQIQYKSEPPVFPLTEIEANRLIRDNYRATLRTRLGAEFTLPLTGISFRTGYFRDPSIRQDRDLNEDKQFLSAGVGFLVDKQVKLDVAFVHGFWKSYNSELDVPGGDTDVLEHVENIKVNR